jgi:hypothetical protein
VKTRVGCVVSVVVAYATGMSAGAQAKPIWIVGGENNIETELTEFRGVLVTSRNVVVLEHDAPFVKVISLKGKLVQTLGRPGAGPGEFRAAYYMWYDSLNTRLVVTDAAAMRITEYPVGDTLEKPKTTLYDYPWLYDVCRMNGRTFGLLRNETIAAELTISGGRLTTLAKFGDQRTNHPLGAHPMVKTRASDGPMFCDAATGRLIIGSAILGEIHVLSTVTHAHKMAAVPAFQMMRITTEGRSMSMFSAPSWEILRDIVRFGDQIIAVVETHVDDKTQLPTGGAYRYFTIDATGALQGGTRHRWRPVALKSGGAICATAYPAPAVAMFAGVACP